MNIEDIAASLGLEATLSPATITRFLTDSRSLEEPEGSLFFAIATKGNDGHRYIRDLYDKGVRNFVVTHIPDQMKESDANFLVVPDTVAALQRITRRPEDFHGEILAITGSRGKTTLKEWIFQLMEPLSDISRSPRSYNSQIGVPLSMLELRPDTRLGIIEAGISRRGEMASLTACILPDTVIITNIGDAHASGFASLREKAEEKALLASSPRTRTVIFRADDTLIRDAVAAQAPQAKTLTWSYEKNPDADILLSALPGAENTTIEYAYKDETHSFRAPLLSEADLENAANALAFMLHSGIDADTIAERFANLHKIGTRLNVTEGVNGCSVILDSYTSDFSSLRPALDFLRRRKMPQQTATLILSDLHHEALPPQALYRDIAALIRRAGVSRFIGIGPVISRHSALFGPDALIFPDTDAMLAALSTADFSNEAILIKGSPECNFSSIARMLETRTHETVLEVNLDAILSNYNYFRGHLRPATGMVCMVKASGYGAGSYEIAKTLQDAGAAYLAVAVLDEGIDLRSRGISMPIMVMNPKVADYRLMFANRLEPEIYSFEMLRDVIREARKNGIHDYPIHIKLDTGMHRMGFIGPELPELMDILDSSKEVRADSAFSHLATADCPDMDSYTELQLRRFSQYTDYILSRSSHPVKRHVLNTAGILRYPDHQYEMVRLGIGLYGANTLPPEMEKPLSVVSTLRTVIIAVRDWEAGESIGYGRRTILTRPSRIATIPIGYADGMNRHFGRGAVSVIVNGREAPTVGNICMDACMIDVTDIPCSPGDSVEIFGRQTPLQRLADVLDTIPYEVLTSVSPRVKRIYYRE